MWTVIHPVSGGAPGTTHLHGPYDDLAEALIVAQLTDGTIYDAANQEVTICDALDQLTGGDRN
jgi:hypothetical protein